MRKFLAILLIFVFIPNVYAESPCTNFQDSNSVISITHNNDNTVEYCSKLNDAYGLIKDKDTLTILKNFDVNNIESNHYGTINIEGINITLNLNDKTITSSNNKKTLEIIGNGTLEIINSGSIKNENNSLALSIYNNANVILKGGTYTSFNSTVIEVGTIDNNLGKLTIEDNTEIKGNTGISILGNNSLLTINGGKITSLNGFTISDKNSSVKINGGKLISNESAVISLDNGSVEIADGTFTGLNGIIARAGTVKINGGEINAIGNTLDKKTFGEDNILLPLGIAIITDSKDTAPQIEITNGTFKTTNTPVLSNKDNPLEFNITGGTFDKTIEKEYLTDGLGQSLSGRVGKLHNIIIEDTLNGTIEVNKNAISGEEVTLIIKPNVGYILSNLTGTSNEEITITDNKFIMPDSDVKINASFKLDTLNITLVINNEKKENYEAPKGTLQNLLTTLNNTGLNIIGFTDKDNKDLDLNLELTDNMYLIATFNDETINEAPKTLDNILSFVILGLFGIGILVYSSKKFFNE